MRLQVTINGRLKERSHDGSGILRTLRCTLLQAEQPVRQRPSCTCMVNLHDVIVQRLNRNSLYFVLCRTTGLCG